MVSTQMFYENICYTGVWEVDGAAQVVWVQREYFRPPFDREALGGS